MSSYKIVVSSGKGGVGKSMLSSVLAMLFSKEKKVVAVDADVDAPNLHLWLGGVKKWSKVKKISVSEKAVVVEENCPECRQCADICQFGALSFENDRLKVNPFLCEGCGACEVVCPPGVIRMKKVINGEIRIKNNIFSFPLISAQLYPGESGSGKIVDEIKKEGEKFESEMVIIDAPAGIGCPVIAAVNGADFAVLITEPTPSGFSDLKRVLKIVNHFKLPWGVVVNKWDINSRKSEEIIDWAGKNFLGKIGYDQRIFQAIAKLNPIVKTNLPVKLEIEKIFQELLNVLKRLK